MEAPSGECTWLAAEGLRLEVKAAELDRAGNAPEAKLWHQRAAAKLSEAAALCPGAHPDGPALAAYSTELTLRVVYLDSLGRGASAAPLEDHIGEVPSLVMDLTTAAQPYEETVSALLAKGGASGTRAPLSEDGYKIVLALKSEDETKAYVSRVLEADGRRVRSGEETQLTAFAASCCTTAGARSLESLREALHAATWAELNLDPSKDKMEIAVQLEQEAKALDERGFVCEAAQMYERSLAVFRFVLKYDPRTQNAKVKDVVAKRIDELVKRADRLKELLQPTSTPAAESLTTASPANADQLPPDEELLEDRLRRLMES